MTPRQKEIMRMALIYVQANLSDVNDAFAPADPVGNPMLSGKVSVNGDLMNKPTDAELDILISDLQ